VRKEKHLALTLGKLGERLGDARGGVLGDDPLRHVGSLSSLPHLRIRIRRAQLDNASRDLHGSARIAIIQELTAALPGA
jgi:hypothetical protein